MDAPPSADGIGGTSEPFGCAVMTTFSFRGEVGREKLMLGGGLDERERRWFELRGSVEPREVDGRSKLFLIGDIDLTCRCCGSGLDMILFIHNPCTNDCLFLGVGRVCFLVAIL